MSKNSDSLTFAPVDFERDTLADGLTAVGFDPTQQTFFTWLGVVPYLTERPVFSTLGFFASLPGGAHVVFDYGNPSPLGLDQDEYAAARVTCAARGAAVGEPFGSHFETNVLYAKLAALGFREFMNLNLALIRERYFTNRGAPRLTEAATSYARRQLNRGKRISRSLLPQIQHADGAPAPRIKPTHYRALTQIDFSRF